MAHSKFDAVTLTVKRLVPGLVSYNYLLALQNVDELHLLVECRQQFRLLAKKALVFVGKSTQRTHESRDQSN